MASEDVVSNNGSVKIKKLHVEKFRHMKDLSLGIGDNITLIAGQNGTAKSTILGMICQPFSFGTFTGKTAKLPDNSAYTRNYHGEHLKEFKPISAARYTFDCDQVFRLSEKHDFEEDYTYRVFLEGETIDSDPSITIDGLFVKKRKRTDGKIRFVTGPGTSHEKGEGNFPHPVIYLGLNRLFPLANCKKVQLDNTNSLSLSPKQERWFSRQYRKVLLLRESSTNTLEHAHIPNQDKDFLHPINDSHDAESCSAGQDNVGQILTALLSFQQLKIKLQDKYQGGVLVIDEIDATLHPVALENLLKLLIKESIELNLQVIATTHSLHLLKLAYSDPMCKRTNIIALKKVDKKIIRLPSDTYNELEKNLCAESTPHSRPEKITLLCEDKIAESFFSTLLPRGFKQYFKAHHTSSSAGYIKGFAEVRLDDCKKTLFLVDGDIKLNYKSGKKPKNLTSLPGDSSPEKVIYNFINDLAEDDPIWTKFGSTGYSWQVAFRNVDQESPDYKGWYNEEVKKKNWKNKNTAFSLWAKDENNLPAVKKFRKDLHGAIISGDSNIIPTESLEKLIT